MILGETFVKTSVATLSTIFSFPSRRFRTDFDPRAREEPFQQFGFTTEKTCATYEDIKDFNPCKVGGNCGVVMSLEESG